MWSGPMRSELHRFLVVSFSIVIILLHVIRRADVVVGICPVWISLSSCKVVSARRAMVLARRVNQADSINRQWPILVSTSGPGPRVNRLILGSRQVRDSPLAIGQARHKFGITWLQLGSPLQRLISCLPI